MIMAWWKPAAGSLPCYSFGGTYHTSQDVDIARQVASTCGQPHQEIRVGTPFLSEFPAYAERTVHVSDGCAEVACAPVLYGNGVARGIAPVRMTGNYGSQVLRPFAPTFRPSDVPSGVFVPDLSPHFTEAHRTYRALLGRHPVSFAAFCQAPWYHYGLYAVELSQLTVRSPFLDNSLVRTAFGAPHSSLTSADPCLRLIGDGNPALLRIRTDRGLAGDGRRIPAAIRRAFLETTFKAEYARC
jgi:asparagine synthase (glutamine-hydrolysing)